MTSFLKNILKFFLTLFLFNLIILGACKIAFYFPFYFDKFEKKWVPFESVEIGFFGSSHSAYSLKDQMCREKLGHNFRNLSLSGNYQYNTALLIEKLLYHNNKAKIIIGIGNHHLSHYYPEKTPFANDFSENVGIWFPYLSLDDLILLFQKNPKQFLEGILGSISSLKPLVLGYEVSVSRIDLAYKNLNTVNDIFDEKYYQKENLDKLDLPWIKKLVKIINENPNNEFLFLRIPIHKEYFDKLENEKEFEKIISYFKQYQNVKFIDYQPFINQLEDYDFRDFSHLSISGSEKFTANFLTHYMNKSNQKDESVNYNP